MLTSVSETAIITLRSRAAETQMREKLISDEMAVVCYQRLMDFLDDVDRKRIEDQKLPRTLSSHLALRGRKYDKMTTNFLSRHPDGMIVSLGSGFDTRYFRMNLNPSQYLELDLPEVVELKKELIGDAMDYRMIGKSVLDYTWIDDITDTTGKEVLFIMEGLLMYLDEKDVRTLIDRICGSFSQSEMIIELINKKYTQGLYRKMAVRKMKKSAGSDAGEAMNFGLSDGKDIEAFNSKLKLLGQWSYFEDPDIIPKFLGMFGNFRMFSRSQWTIHVGIE